MKCRNCGFNNDSDAEFCVNCGANLKRTSSEGISTLTKMLIIVVIVLVAALGVVSGMMFMNNNQVKNISNNTSSTNNSPNDSTPTTTTTTNAQQKTFNNGIISFQYPSSWDILPNGANTMVIVGLSNYPAFSVYNESKYGHTSLSDYVSESKRGMIRDGYSILSEQSRTVNGLPAYEIVYQGQTIIQQMVLVEKSPGKQYFALVGVDTLNHFDQEINTFNQIINSFKFLL